MKQRVTVYIDGFNLYFGIRDAHWRRYLWLNVVNLAQNLLKRDQELVGVKYFTALIRGNATDPRFMAKQNRQNDYLDALRTLGDVEIRLGKYQLKRSTCQACGVVNRVPTEKMTDVKISLALLEDAVADKYDTAILISGDGDIAPAINSVKASFSDKRMVVAFPPRRTAFELREAADATFTIGRRKLAVSQFPVEVITATGHTLRKPGVWDR